LFLIDGNSLVYRAFFALPESIATSTGEPTNAIFGFASMLVKLITEYGATPTIVAWDAGTSGRTEAYPEYKAQRRSRPDLLREQWPAFEPLVEAFGYRNARVEGFEADDVLATIAQRAIEQGIAVSIVTGDRDAFQLIDEQGLVTVMATARGITETKLYDRAAVIERYGIAPEQIPDFYGLKGDTSDNIPGVPGIGEKTAAELLATFGTLESLLERTDEVSGVKRRENLVAHRADAIVSKQLATMQRDLPLEISLADVLAAEPDLTALRETFRRYELRDPLRRLEEALGGVPSAPPPAGVSGPVGVVREVALARLAGIGGEVAVAVCPPLVPEGALFGDGGPWRFGVATGEAEVLVGDCAGPAELIAALGDRAVVAHDAKALGTVPAGLSFDTMIAAYLLDPARRGYPLGELCEDRGIDPGHTEQAAWQAAAVAALAVAQRPELAQRGLTSLFDEVELPLVAVLRAMEEAGIALDLDRLAAITARVQGEVAQLEHSIHGAAGEEFLIGSPQQLGSILFEKLTLSRKRRGKTGYSTDARVLAAIRDEHEIVPMVERWRELSTLVKTYLEPLPALVDEHSRLHTTFVQTVAATGRLSSVNPNLQNVPIRTPLGREIRGCFVAGPGCVLLAADYSQVELRVLAQLAQEGDLPSRRGRPHRHRLPGLRRRRRAARCRHALEGEDGELRDCLRADGFRPCRSSADPARGGGRLHRHILRALPGRARVHREDDRAGDRTGLRDDATRAPPPDSRAARAQPPAACARRALGGQHRHPGHGGRHHQGRDGALPARRRRAALPADPADPRRAAVRGAAGGDGGPAQARRDGDGRRLGARPAAGGRPRRRPELARGEMTIGRAPAIVRCCWRRRL
jgi:DNA polymerase-1